MHRVGLISKDVIISQRHRGGYMRAVAPGANFLGVQKFVPHKIKASSTCPHREHRCSPCRQGSAGLSASQLKPGEVQNPASGDSCWHSPQFSPSHDSMSRRLRLLPGLGKLVGAPGMPAAAAKAILKSPGLRQQAPVHDVMRQAS